MELVKEQILRSKGIEVDPAMVGSGSDGGWDPVGETLAGTPQGGVMLPLVANIYLNKLDRIWAARCSQLGVLVRYADDLVAMCHSARRRRGGSAAADGAGDESARTDAASGEN